MLENGVELFRNQHIRALLVMRGVRQYVYFSIDPSRCREKALKSRAVVVCHRVNNLALVVTLPWMQQAATVLLSRVGDFRFSSQGEP